MQNKISELLNNFNIKGELKSLKHFTSGHINSTILVEIEDQGKTKQYVLQKINHNVFKHPDEVMSNISKATNHIKNEIRKNGGHSTRRVLKFYPSTNGKYFYKNSEDEYWRIYKFVNNSTTFNSTSNLTVLEETGKAFGEFQLYLENFPAEELYITIPHFHNTINRYEIFEEILKKDAYNRAGEVGEEIEEYRLLKSLATKMYKMQKNKELELRVTHNDTKCNNVLFDKDTHEHLCVIDLDTIMPGLIGFDFGDAIRFGASSASEDETDLDKVTIDLNKFEAFTKGFLSTAGKSLTDKEIETLSLGAITMTIECGLRFLTDYLDGDHYFKTSYHTHNLDRTRCQLKLAQEMIKNYSAMQEIVNKYTKIYTNQQ